MFFSFKLQTVILTEVRLQVLTLHILEQKAWTNKFFSLWFSSIDSFSRVHDKKLSIAAIVALLTLNADQVPVSVQQGWPRLLQVSSYDNFRFRTTNTDLLYRELCGCSRHFQRPQ